MSYIRHQKTEDNKGQKSSF